MKSLIQGVKYTRVMNAVAAGATDQTSSIIDMAGFEGVAFVVAYGTLAAVQGARIKLQQGAAAAMGDAADLEATSVGPMADDDDNQLQWVEIIRPRERYVRLIVVRSEVGSPAGTAAISGVMAMQFGGDVPVTQSTTIKTGERHVDPIEGTA